jgi:hypothetical protein
MLFRGNVRRRGALVVLVVALVASAFSVGASGAGATRSVRGFDGSTIKVGGLGPSALLGTSQIGAGARIQRFNEDNEIKGVKLEYVGFNDDNSDPSTALNSARKMVTQDQVFAVVGNTSRVSPREYFETEHVPVFGWGFDVAYCDTPQTTKGWMFGYAGCQVNPEPSKLVDFGGQPYRYLSEATGKKTPTIALVTNDNTTGKATLSQNKIAYAGAGFDVVYAESNVPPPPVGDYAPYAQQLMTANDGKAPDVIRCMMSVECLQIYNLVKAQGFTGQFNHSLFTDVLVKPFADSSAIQASANLSATGIPALDQMKADIEAFKPGTKLDTTIMTGYASTDMLIQALKKVAKGGTSKITPENVRKAAAVQTWEMKDFIGPVVYPVASNRQQPYCTSMAVSNGTVWETVEEFSCSNRTFNPKTGKANK